MSNFKVHIVSFYDNKTNTELGEFFPNGKTDNQLIKEIRNIKLNPNDQKGLNDCNTIKGNTIYWKITKQQVVVFLVCESSIPIYSVDCLLEDIEGQNVVKYLDKQKNLNNVAKQNLQYLIDKHVDSKSDTSSKLSSLKEDVNNMKKDMTKNIKSIVSNIEDSKVLDERAAKIKDTTILFAQNSSEILRVSKMRRLKNILIIVGIAVILSLLAYYLIF